MFTFVDSIMAMKKVYKIFALVFFLILAAGCSKDWENEFAFTGSAPGTPSTGREENEVTRRVLLLYAAGHNNLGYYSHYIPKNIKDLTGNWLPGEAVRENVLLIYSHIANDSRCKPSPSHLIRVYKNHRNEIISDTLVTYSESAISASAEQLNRVLTDVKELVYAKSYGMIFSSHATGYLPAGFSPEYKFTELSSRKKASPTVTQYVERFDDPSQPMVKSIGQDKEGTLSYEINLPEFAAAIPMKMDYIIFDACLMGGIEVAYELKDKCDRLAFSQAEILADGFNYKTLTQRLLKDETADVRGAGEDYFALYESKFGQERSATISVVDCSGLDDLAEVCKELFEAHKTELSELWTSKTIQQFHRTDKYSMEHFHFYDLESVATEIGATEEELDALRYAIGGCVPYKACTNQILGDVTIETFCGLSMYVPGKGGDELDKFYRTLSWNKATELVK